MKSKNYEIYRTKKTKQEFFDTWIDDNLKKLTTELKDYIYGKYLLKFNVFNRDKFICQNSKCKNLQSPLTLHHFKFRKNCKDGNGGWKIEPDRERNCVTLCQACHRRLHRGKSPIIYKNVEYLPEHIRGKTQCLHKQEIINWKQLKNSNKKLRQTIKNDIDEKMKQLPVGKRVWFNITWEQIYYLLKFLDSEYVNNNDD